jgi:hypothetical protein
VVGLALKMGKWRVGTSDLFVAAAMGVIFGAFNFLMVFVLGNIWAGIESRQIDGIRFYHSFGPLPGGHAIITGLCLVILCGFASGYLSKKRGCEPRITILLGGLAGFAMSIIPFSPSWMVIWSSPTFLQIDNFVKIFGITAVGLIISVPLAALSAYAYLQVTTIKYRQAENKELILVAALATIIIILAPPFIAETGISMGWIEKYPDMYTISWQVKVERTANDTIVIANPGFQTSSGIDIGNYLNEGLPFLISIDGKNASNSAAINCSGLRLAINPDSGLGRQPGRTARFTGQDVSVVNGTSVHVLLNYQDGGLMRAYTGYV